MKQKKLKSIVKVASIEDRLPLGFMGLISTRFQEEKKSVRELGVDDKLSGGS